MEKQIRIANYSNYPIPYIDLEKCIIDVNLKNILNKNQWKRLNAVPIEIVSDKIINVCIIEPNLDKIEEIRKKTKKTIGVFYSTKDKINKYLYDLFNMNYEHQEIKWRG